jgi:hypothetical protein
VTHVAARVRAARLEDDEAMDRPATRPDRTLVAILAIIAILVISSLVVVLTRREAAVLDPSTPAGTVQAYAAAVIDGDRRAAATYLTHDARDRCDPMMPRPSGTLRVRLLTTDERADSARVRVLVVQSSGGGPLGSSDYDTEDAFDLVKVAGQWKVDTAPWQLSVCPEKGSTP